LHLREALKLYATKLRVSTEDLNKETFEKDYLDETEWKALELINNQLEPLFRLTKDLEGNHDLKDGARKASHGALWEVLPIFEFVLSHFKKFKKQSKQGLFNSYKGI
jgi:hypothetical protein